MKTWTSDLRDKRQAQAAQLLVQIPCAVHLFLSPLPSMSGSASADRLLRVDDTALDMAESISVRPSPSRTDSSQAAQQVASQAASTSKRRPSGRISFSSVLKHRPSFVERWRAAGGDEEAGVGGEMPSPKVERPPIPSALQPPPEVYSTPLPMISMTVLSIVCPRRP